MNVMCAFFSHYHAYYCYTNNNERERRENHSCGQCVRYFHSNPPGLALPQIPTKLNSLLPYAFCNLSRHELKAQKRAMATKPCGDDLESLQVLRYQDSHVQIPTPSRRVSPPTSRRAPGYKLNSDLAKESRNMKVRWYHRHTPTILNFPTTGCVGVPNSPNTSLYTCEFEEQLRINGEEGGSGAPVPQRLYENRKGTKLCSCCAAHGPNSMLFKVDGKKSRMSRRDRQRLSTSGRKR